MHLNIMTYNPMTLRNGRCPWPRIAELFQACHEEKVQLMAIQETRLKKRVIRDETYMVLTNKGHGGTRLKGGWMVFQNACTRSSMIG